MLFAGQSAGAQEEAEIKFLVPPDGVSSRGPVFYTPARITFADGTWIDVTEIGKHRSGGFMHKAAFEGPEDDAPCAGQMTHALMTSFLDMQAAKVVHVFHFLSIPETADPLDVPMKAVEVCESHAYLEGGGNLAPERMAHALDLSQNQARATLGEPSAPAPDIPGGEKVALKSGDAGVILSAIASGDPASLVSAILKQGDVDGVGDELLSEMEERIFAYVRPLPAANIEANRDAYAALELIDPKNDTYRAKADHYKAAAEERRTAILNGLKKQSDEFSGVTFYTHPNKPRYADTRSYIAPYIGLKGGRVWMRLELHYTNDSWLFIQDASVNVDNEIVRFEVDEWKRDNDSEIWEWADIGVDDDLRGLLRRIADSEKSVIRFNGRQYYDNITVSETDKQIIRDMLLAEEVLRSRSEAMK